MDLGQVIRARVWPLRELTATAKLLLLELAEGFGRPAAEWPGYDGWAVRLGVGRNSIVRAMAELQAGGWIEEASAATNRLAATYCSGNALRMLTGDVIGGNGRAVNERFGVPKNGARTFWVPKMGTPRTAVGGRGVLELQKAQNSKFQGSAFIANSFSFRDSDARGVPGMGMLDEEKGGAQGLNPEALNWERLEGPGKPRLIDWCRKFAPGIERMPLAERVAALLRVSFVDEQFRCFMVARIKTADEFKRFLAVMCRFHARSGRVRHAGRWLQTAFAAEGLA